MPNKTKIKEKDKSNFVKLPAPVCVWQWVWVTETRRVAVSYPSDGLFPEYTQKLQGLPGGNYYTIHGANHVEVRNMSNSSQGDLTYDTFYDIWERPLWDFFHTEER